MLLASATGSRRGLGNTLGPMRWEQLFDDLEAQFGAEERRERDSEVADRTRRERANVEFLGRCAAALGHRVRVRVSAGAQLDGEVLDLGADWLLLRLQSGRDAVVPVPAIVGVEGLPVRATDATTARRFGLGSVLRGLSRDRAAVALTDSSGQVLTGTIDFVGADALDLTEHALEEIRRAENVRGRRTVPFWAVALVEAR